MKKPAALFPIVLALGAMTLALVPEAQAQGSQEGPFEIEKCQTINKPGSYKLVKNVVSTGGNCLLIAADEVTIDLAGFTISSNGTGTGVAAVGGPVLLGIAVRNGSISNFDTGVVLEAANGSVVEGLRVSGPPPGAPGGVGIAAHGIVRGNTVVQAPATGITGSGTFTGNYVTNSDAGFGIDAGSTVIGNTAVNNRGIGIFVFCPSNVTDNTALDNPQGNLVLSGEGCNNTNNVAP